MYYAAGKLRYRDSVFVSCTVNFSVYSISIAAIHTAIGVSPHLHIKMYMHAYIERQGGKESAMKIHV